MLSQSSKAAERAELEEALRRFQASGGEISEIPILMHREEFLRRDMREFDRARDVAVANGKRAERDAQPDYLRSVRAMKHKA